MRFLWMIAFVTCALTLVKAPAVAASGSTVCPSVVLIESTNGTYYIAVFEAPAPTKVSLDLTLYARNAVYAVSAPGITIAKPLTTISGSFRSAPVIIKNPGSDELLGAAVVPSPGSPQAASCDGENVVIPSVASLTAPDRHIPPAVDALETELVTEAASAQTILVPNAASTPAPNCTDPFDDASVDVLVKPVFSADVRSDPSMTSIAIRVQLDEHGKVLQAAVESSSGSAAVDAIALEAAKETTYHPARFACQPERSSHVIRVDFSH